jgi:predicted RNA binding protein YcfA (HicA-like mRNA interferase family)
MNVRDVVKLVEEDGWFLAVTRGNHRQYKHPVKPRRVTIAGHPSHDLVPTTLDSIFQQAQLKKPAREKR